MLVSQHRDGQWLSNAATKMGFRFVSGSTNSGGTDAIRKLKKLSNTSGIGITPDGPRGPRREMALGPIYLASRLGLPIVPTGFGFDRPHRLKTWDRFAIPKPFCRARSVMDEKIWVPRKLRKEGLEEYRIHVQSRIENVTKIAEDWAGSRDRMNEEHVFRRKPNRIWRDKTTIPVLTKTDKAEKSRAA